MKISEVNGFPEIDADTALQHLKELRLIDVRTSEEYTGELGHIENSELISLGPDVMNLLESADKNEPILFICRSGGRSGQATMVSRQLGFKKTYNLIGGMLEWNRKGLPKAKI
jgi:rhodanese-related sulfurtransferase